MNLHVKPHTVLPRGPALLEEEPSNTIAKPSLENLRQLIKMYAPILCFSEENSVQPGNVDWYLEKSWLVNATASSRQAAKGNLRYLDDGARYHLQLKEGVNRDQYKIVPRSYVRVRNHNETHIDLQYWFFYPHTSAFNLKLRWVIDGINGHETSINLHPVGTLEGTWEHITIRVNDRTGEAEQVYLQGADEGTWIKFSEMKRLRHQVVVYVSSNRNAFYHDKHLRVSNKSRFDLHSSELEFLLEHKMGDARSCDFSLFSELVSVSYLPEFVSPAFSWLQYNHHWCNPKPDHLNTSHVKQLLHAGLGKNFEFLLSRDIVNSFSDKLLEQTRELYVKKAVSPRFQPAWEGELV